MRKKILIIAAHPDDEILGCGGTIAKFVKEGDEAYTLILGEGIASRYERKQGERRKRDIKRLRKQTYKANEVIGVKDVFIYDFPDNSFDKVASLDIVKIIEKAKRDIKPDIVYTHHRGDLNIDHRITYNAALTACRPIKGETVKEIYSFEAHSSTEWNYPYTFNPNVFIDITQTIDKKLEALRYYSNELREFPHPRSEENIQAVAKRWGSVVGLNYAETFELIRNIQ